MPIALQALAILVLFHAAPASITLTATPAKLPTISSITAASRNARSITTLTTLRNASPAQPTAKSAPRSLFAYNAVLGTMSSTTPACSLVHKPTIKVCRPAPIMIIACLAKPTAYPVVLQSTALSAILVSSNSTGSVSPPALFCTTQSTPPTVTAGNVPPTAPVASTAHTA